MLTLEIGNSYSQLKNLTADQFKSIRKILSYEIDQQAAYFSNNHFNTRRYLIDAKGHFPTGLLTYVKQWLKDKPHRLTDTRTKPLPKPGIIKPKLGSIKPYPDQLEVVEKAIRFGRCGASLPTGSGKSLIIALLAARLGLKTICIVPTLELKSQLSKSLLEWNITNVVVENIDNPKLKTMTGFDCLILDECHRAGAQTYQRLNRTAWKDIYYRFFLSGTFFRNQENEQLIFEGICGQVCHRVTYKQAVERGYIVPVEAFSVTLPKVPVEGYTYAQVYSELVVNNEYRNARIASMLEALDADGKFTLCLVKEIKHGETLSALSGFPFANGQDEASRQYIEQLKAGKIETLIATTGIFSEGVDSKPVEFVVIACLGKAKSAFMQQVGRGVRHYPGKDSCKVILFQDKSHKWTKSHFDTQKKILMEEYGVSVVPL